MRKYFYLLHDVFCVLLALLIALYLRNGWELIQEGKPNDLVWAFGITALVAFFVLPATEVHNGLWRYTSLGDILRIILSVTLIVLISNSLIFLLNRLDVMPRSVPLIQWALAIAGMSSSRLFVQKWLGAPRMDAEAKDLPKQHVLVVGVGPIADIYLQFVRRILHNRVVVEGFMDDNKKLKGRAFQKFPIFGSPKDIPEIIERLHVHGIRIKQVVLTQKLEALPESSRIILETLKERGTIELVNFHKQIGPIMPHMLEDKVAMTTPLQDAGLAEAKYETVPGLYPYVKRGIDILGAAILSIVCLPLIMIAAILVFLDVGLPLFFWQQRPGLHNRPFRLYKFRTMRHSTRQWDEERLAHKARDKDRMSFIGRNIRRFRLDEIPQLYHIMAGSMSFVGPRPLLPDDQPKNGEVRLSVRPGVTGWAQIHGGDELTPEQKLVLDHWYIRNMSLWLDIKIVFRTLVVAIKGDKPAPHVVKWCMQRLEPQLYNKL